MNRVEISRDGDECGRIEIRAKDERWFWGIFVVFSFVALIRPVVSFASLRLVGFLFWSIWLLGLAICQLRGWTGVLWSRNGREILTISLECIDYRTVGGTFMDRTHKCVRLTQREAPAVEVLPLAIPASGYMTRLRIKAASGSLLIGRNLSKEDARHIQSTIRDWTDLGRLRRG